MELKRKRGIKKFKINHNKKLFYLILGLSLILLLMIFKFRDISRQDPLSNNLINNSDNSLNTGIGSISYDSPISDEGYCKTDGDCVTVQASCCPCERGGKEVCVSESNKYLFEQKKELCSEDIYCPTVYNCIIKSCVCNNGKCEANADN